MNICMIGGGYVGLVSAACFSEFGWQVKCVDKDEAKVAELVRGEMPIYEPGLEDLVARNVASGRLSFTTDLGPAVRDADVVLLAVGTPMRRGDGYADLSYIFAAVEDLAPHLEGFTVVVTWMRDTEDICGVFSYDSGVTWTPITVLLDRESSIQASALKTVAGADDSLHFV